MHFPVRSPSLAEGSYHVTQSNTTRSFVVVAAKGWLMDPGIPGYMRGENVSINKERNCYHTYLLC